MRRVIFLVMFFGFVCAVSAATYVTGAPVTVQFQSGVNVALPVTISASSSVSGFNGQLNYDSTVFSNPEIKPSSASSGFIFEGNEIAPGRYRFVAYADPTQKIWPGTMAFYFLLQSKTGLTVGNEYKATYSLLGASNANGVSMDTVSFGDATMKVWAPENAAKNWPLYD